MGAAASLPDVMSAAQAEELLGEMYDAEQWAAMADADGNVTREVSAISFTLSAPRLEINAPSPLRPFLKSICVASQERFRGVSSVFEVRLRCA